MQRSERILIVNADDFGQSPGVNSGIAAAAEHGIVTSASLMVRWPAAADAADYARRHSTMSLGLHVDLGEWRYVNGTWEAVYCRVDLDDQTAVQNELAGQLDEFRRLVGTDPSHLDSHQHVHRRPLLEPLFRRCAERLGIPLRQCSSEIRYCGAFYGQTAEGTPMPNAITVEGLIALFDSLGVGITELGCHPGDASDLEMTMYRAERAREVQVLCDLRIRVAIERAGIALRSFTGVLSRMECPS
jgi:chitin disaccharide deacetylase